MNEPTIVRRYLELKHFCNRQLDLELSYIKYPDRTRFGLTDIATGSQSKNFDSIDEVQAFVDGNSWEDNA